LRRVRINRERRLLVSSYPSVLTATGFGDICLCRLYENLYRNSNTGHFTFRPKYVCIVDCRTKYFVARQRSKGNPFLRLYGNNRQFYIVDSYRRSTTI
jgi:hypothetical protein